MAANVSTFKEAEAEKSKARILAELKKMRETRQGEPTRFEQAAGELYCWWDLPIGIQAKEITVESSRERLLVEVCGVRIFEKQLFHEIKEDVIWSLDGSELSLTLTKRERSRLWDQLGAVSEIARGADGRVIKSSIPEPMSMNDRLEKFRQMVTGDLSF